MKKPVAILFVAIFALGMVSISLVSDQFVDAGSRKKVHFTQTITSSQDPGQGHEGHQFALLLSPNQGTIYDGSMTFTSSEKVQIAVLHEISQQDAKGQDVWTVDGNNFYGLSLIGVGEKSGSLEFTGAALALHSMNSKEFTATVSIDAWIRGQPTEVMMQKIELEKEAPSLLLSRSNVPATIPMHQGIYEGKQVLYIITDGSDDKYAQSISERQGWRVEHAPSLKDTPEDFSQTLFVFKNGVKGNGIFGFQDEIISNTPSQESKYSALSSVIEATWKQGQRPTLLESAEDVIAAEEGGRIEFDKSGIILNAPPNSLARRTNENTFKPNNRQ